MSAEPELARFDTRRTAQTEESIEQTDFRTIGAREHGQLALNEIESGVASIKNQASLDNQGTTGEPTRTDLEAALECARATIDGLRKQVEKLEAERDRHPQETEPEGGR